jgi:hypothetical protein
MSKTNFNKNILFNHPILAIVIAVLGFCLGLLFIFMQSFNKPIPRSEAVFYSRSFESYDSYSDYPTINCTDGSYFQLYPHTISADLDKQLESLSKGTRLLIGVNPNNDYIIELKAGSRELLNFETSQRDIDRYDNGYIAIGVFMCFASIALILIIKGDKNAKREEKILQANRLKNPDAFLRIAEETKKQKILLETEINGYTICYRRIKFVNELVINGKVYDERKGIIEYPQKLIAIIGEDKIEA